MSSFLDDGFTSEEAEKRRECGLLKNMNVRFFIYAMIDDELDLLEVTEQEFLSVDGTVSYERHTVFSNGCSQICLTKKNI